jgi:arsenical pump membrane protein
VTASHALAWSVAASAILLILWRPRHIPEAVWACGGALLLTVAGAISWHGAAAAVLRGLDVYCFLTGMMLLAELARSEHFFDWIAARAVRAAGGSASRLFGLVYLTGTAVTICLSNDATAVVLTPAVLAAARAAKAPPLPLLLICAFIANAASFVLPISNPANLVVYGSHMPPLLLWLKTFGFASIISITLTFLGLRFLCRGSLQQAIEHSGELVELSAGGRRAAFGIAFAGVALIAASALNVDLGLPTLAAALFCAALVWWVDRRALAGAFRQISWSVLPLVAGLFVLVEAVNDAGAMQAAQAALHWLGQQSPVAGSVAAAFGVALGSNIVNNLPAGLLVAGAVHSYAPSPVIRDALLIGVDLGPNLSVTGSLATILWLVALRREGQHVSAWLFLRYGAALMPATLMAAILAMTLTASW